ncbi:uncharacterized protein LY89DRAFT_592825 [Mollisia scopiformis]|uniref:Glyoxalase-like domain-containing protein n=1 Tax=Mollisia scopiformis TaxID=149040 RepID=A0A194WWK1_MOLSC|nr:uncharacterized protein LY89DRAFT_592825 [Mollisia scopiformis]KUJ12325.1 hypothetical protein LY89DRAFT_592825 [Mollisia scopiformis]
MAPSPTRLRQIALVAADLDRARQLLTRVIGTEVIFEDPAVAQWGLKNFLVPIGGDIIEVVSPFRPDTPASRQLSKRGDGGYMIIMQTLDANARNRYIEEHKLAKVIFCHELEESVCIQYHPKGIKGGVIPELDSHHPSTSYPNPILERFSPWHAAGPPSAYTAYSAGMKRHSGLHLLSVALRLAPGDRDTSAAAEQWEGIFGVSKGKREGEIEFTNATMSFIPGEQEKSEGIVEIVIGVEGQERLSGIQRRATEEGLKFTDSGCIDMLGIRWRFLQVAPDEIVKSRI